MYGRSLEIFRHDLPKVNKCCLYGAALNLPSTTNTLQELCKLCNMIYPFTLHMRLMKLLTLELFSDVEDLVALLSWSHICSECRTDSRVQDY